MDFSWRGTFRGLEGHRQYMVRGVLLGVAFCNELLVVSGQFDGVQRETEGCIFGGIYLHSIYIKR